MASYVLFAIIGVKINAPFGYWLVFGIGITCWLINLLLKEN